MTAKHMGAVLRLHRKTAGLTRVALARLSGVGKTTIFDIEHGKESVQIRSLLLIMEALSIEMRFESRVMDSIEDLLKEDLLK